MADLSAYELQRLENIRRNEAALAALGLGPGGSVALNKKPLPKRRAQRVKGQTLATRASARLAASGRMDRDLDSDLDPDSDPDLGSDPGSDPGNQTQTSKVASVFKKILKMKGIVKKMQMAAKMAKRAFGSRFQKSIVFCIGKALKAAHKLKNSKTGRYMTALLATSDPSADVWISKMEAELLGMKCAATPGFDGIFVKKDGIDLHMTKRTKSGYVGVGSDPGRARVGFNVANQATGSNFHRTSVAAALVVAQLHGPAICRACKPLFHNCWKPFTACTCEV